MARDLDIQIRVVHVLAAYCGRCGWTGKMKVSVERGCVPYAVCPGCKLVDGVAWPVRVDSWRPE